MAGVLERVILALSPGWAASRARARHLAQRHYEAASIGRRTQWWNRSGADANAALSGALPALRGLSRDLVRNNPWARRAVQAITNNTVGWGLTPKVTGPLAGKFKEAWKTWAETTECDADGRLTFAGIERQVMRTVVESGEVLVRVRPRRPTDGLTVPMQLQIIEPDLIDTARDAQKGQQGGPIIQGIEFDALMRRVAYWLFPQHPGGLLTAAPVSRRVPADGIFHVYEQDRPGQVRGVPWLAAVLMRLRDFDEYEEATLIRQKIAACFAAFVTDAEGTGLPLAEPGTDAASGAPTDTLEPGMIEYLPPGKEVTFGIPPSASDHPSFSAAQLRSIASGLGVTYEDLTGDYSQSNFSASRMGRIAHWGNVEHWRWNLLVPQFAQPAVDAFVSALTALETPRAPTIWTAPPAPMIDPDKEGLALMRMVRTGAKTHDEMVREQGRDPEEFWAEYAAGLERLDKMKITLDSDPRRVSQNGVAQAAKPGEEPAPAAGDGEEEPAPPPKPNGKPKGAAEEPART